MGFHGMQLGTIWKEVLKNSIYNMNKKLHFHIATS